MNLDFQNPDIAKKILSRINQKSRNSNKPFKIMEFCGGHTHTLFKYGIMDLLDKNVQLLHGPGCPVCVLPRSRVDSILQGLKNTPALHLFCYGDLLRIPGSNGKSLLKAKSEGANIHLIYSPHDSVLFAEKNPDKEIIFIGLGFETTTPPTALAIKEAHIRGLKNFSVHCNHVLTPPALECLLGDGSIDVDGFIAPGHVSSVIGVKPYEYFSKKYKKSFVASGFEALDLLQSIELCIDLIIKGTPKVVNQYFRVVRNNGNPKSLNVMDEVFEIRKNFEWRGLGSLPNSALKIKDFFSIYDAEVKYEFPIMHTKEHPGCLCGNILKGLKKPQDCSLFGKICNPENPLGSCMVSSEGACAAVYQYSLGNSVEFSSKEIIENASQIQSGPKEGYFANV